MPNYKVRATLQGSTVKNKTHQTYTVFGADIVEASGNWGAAVASLEAVTRATVTAVTISELLSSDSTEPPAETDVFDALQVSVHINPTGQVTKLATISIPAPVAGILDASGEAGDNDNTTLQAWILAMELNEFRISDNEVINTALGHGGIYDSWKINKPKNYKD